MAGSPWTNQVVNLIVLTEAATGFSGLFGYSPTAGAGNLIFSLAANSGTDSYGNAYLAGATSYTNVLTTFFAANLDGGVVSFFASTAGAGGPYTDFAAIGFSFAGSTGHMVFSATDGTFPLGSLALSGSGGASITGGLATDTLTVNSGAAITGGLTVDTINGSANTGTPSTNSTSTNGLANGQIAGTSGGASAGTAHTHSPGSYAVTSGQHSHDLQNHEHAI